MLWKDSFPFSEMHFSEKDGFEDDFNRRVVAAHERVPSGILVSCLTDLLLPMGYIISYSIVKIR